MPKSKIIKPQQLIPRGKLYIGVSQLIAKTATLKPLEPPLILSNTYPGYFALHNSPPDGRWGIIEVDAESIFLESLRPFHGYIERITRGKSKNVEKRRRDILTNIKNYGTSWKKSLEHCGVCISTSILQPMSISRITIFDPASNSYIRDEFAKVNPWEIKPAEHRDNFHQYSSLTRWLIGDDVSYADWIKNDKLLIILTEECLCNRMGLDLYYRRADKDKINTYWKL